MVKRRKENIERGKYQEKELGELFASIVNILSDFLYQGKRVVKKIFLYDKYLGPHLGIQSSHYNVLNNDLTDSY